MLGSALQSSGYYRAGPALEGTACGEGKWCQGGSCVANKKVSGSPQPPQPGRWSDWVAGRCQSGCTVGSLGSREKTRHCQQDRIIHTLDDCREPKTGMDFCDDTAICDSRKELSR